MGDDELGEADRWVPRRLFEELFGSGDAAGRGVFVAGPRLPAVLWRVERRVLGAMTSPVLAGAAGASANSQSIPSATAAAVTRARRSLRISHQ